MWIPARIPAPDRCKGPASNANRGGSLFPADALLTFAGGTLNIKPNAITAGFVASDANSSKPTTAQLGEGAVFRGFAFRGPQFVSPCN